MNEHRRLSSDFSQNRFEEVDEDLWGNYVLPLNFIEYSLFNFTKSSHVVGGRGSGKTTFLRYHCFPTILSPKKDKIVDKDLEKIGIYWRPDSELMSDINEITLSKEWKIAFNVYVGISLLIELSRFIQLFSESNYIDSSQKQKAKELILPKSIGKVFNLTDDILFIDFQNYGYILRSELSDWLSFSITDIPLVFRAKDKIELIIKIVIKSLDVFKNTRFYILIDEFENLTIEQQKIINTWIKHVNKDVIFNIAYKKYYKPTNLTVGSENITEVHDYRVIDVEEDVCGNEDKFKLLVAEIVINKIQMFYEKKYKEISELDNDYLSNLNYLSRRIKDDYRLNILKIIGNIFPTYSFKEIAKVTLNDNALLNKIKDSISDAIEEQGLNFKPENFINFDYPEESILNGILIHRKSISANKLYEWFTTDIEQYNSFKDNTLLGAILYFYDKYHAKTATYYGGFNRFIKMSRNNIRHFLELAHQSIIQLEQSNKNILELENFQISVEMQSIAAKKTSTAEIDRKIEELGKHGLILKTIVERLGKIFLLSQKRRTQSEPEVIQFSITFYKDNKYISSEDEKRIKMLIEEAKMWSVLIEKRNTKIKDPSADNSLNEYHLHPIVSPYFGISPRQKRKLDLSYKDIKTIFLDDEKEYQSFYNNLSKKWQVNVKSKVKSLPKTLWDFE